MNRELFREKAHEYCCNRLHAIEFILYNMELTSAQKLRIITEQAVLTNIITNDTVGNFATIEEIDNYLKNRVDLVCGIQE